MKKVKTEIRSFDQFYTAEQYHQKYYLQHDAILMREFSEYSEKDFLHSTVAARLNGAIHGFTSGAKQELSQYGLSKEGTSRLQEVLLSWKGREPPQYC